MPEASVNPKALKADLQSVGNNAPSRTWSITDTFVESVLANALVKIAFGTSEKPSLYHVFPYGKLDSPIFKQPGR